MPSPGGIRALETLSRDWTRERAGVRPPERARTVAEGVGKALQQRIRDDLDEVVGRSFTQVALGVVERRRADRPRGDYVGVGSGVVSAQVVIELRGVAVARSCA